MSETFEIEELEERVVLVGVSQQDGDDAEDSLEELKELRAIGTDAAILGKALYTGRLDLKTVIETAQD